MAVAQRTGIENYAAALVREIAALYSTRVSIDLTVYLHAGNPFVSAAYVQEAVELLSQARIRHRVYAGRRGYGLALSAYTGLDRLQLLHLLRRSRPWFLTCPYVMTVHDIKSVGLSREGQRLEHACLSDADRRTVLGASRLIAISQSTRADLQAEFREDLTSVVRVIPLGFDPKYFEAHRQKAAVCHKYGLDRYILFVGTLQHRKNLPRLIEAFARLKSEHLVPHKLVLAGRDGWGAESVYAAAAEHDVRDSVVFPGYVPDMDLPGLYAGADLFAYPSLHEGFGIPILEAMASGTIVLTSSLFSMPEVAGDAAVYVDPYSVEDMAAGLWRALSNDGLRTSLVKQGRARAHRFTWRQMAVETLRFYGLVATRTTDQVSSHSGVGH
jgi:glycosyltransferase involved in cell wall biosynthesis